MESSSYEHSAVLGLESGSVSPSIFNSAKSSWKDEPQGVAAAKTHPIVKTRHTRSRVRKPHMDSITGKSDQEYIAQIVIIGSKSRILYCQNTHSRYALQFSPILLCYPHCPLVGNENCTLR